MDLNIEKAALRVPALVGMQSCIGVYGSPPFAWGNYFWFKGSNPPTRVLNFWAENLKAAADLFLLDGNVDIIKWEWDATIAGKTERLACCIIRDSRIPEDWHYNKLCFTGGHLPPLEVAKEIYSILGDPANELERFTDREMYYAKRGHVVFENFVSSDGTPSEILVANLLAKRAAQNQTREPK